MLCATLLYPNDSDTRFDFDYYLQTHIPMAKKVFGDGIEVSRGMSAPDGTLPKYVVIVRIPIESVDQFTRLAAEKAGPVMADIPNFTNVTPLMQFDEVLR